ncbi:MAG TPA: HD domain-containing protein [archaeon]|jgi:uncharacterized protein|nr:HD domain-containing protein [archaeon]
MNKKKIIEKTKEYVKQEMLKGDSGHDWSHVLRVNNTAKMIAKKEKADLFIVELSTLFHDIADSKFTNGDETIAPRKIKDFLNSLKVDTETIEKVNYIVEHMSFKKNQPTEKSLEFKVVQDADRLDAIGAIGIARAFSFGGYKNRLMYNPEEKPNLNQTKEQYVKAEGTTINHFYEKLLLLKDLMNTETAKAIAEKRHKFMEKYLDQFYKEWNGKA